LIVFEGFVPERPHERVARESELPKAYSGRRLPLSFGRTPCCALCCCDMARTYLIFGDIEGKLDVLRVECTKCERKGRYSVAKLIEKHGRKGNMSAWVSDLKGECPKRDAAGLQDRCEESWELWEISATMDR
jgi:hypothetical protein